MNNNSNQEKNGVKIKFGTEVQEYVRNHPKNCTPRKMGKPSNP